MFPRSLALLCSRGMPRTAVLGGRRSMHVGGISDKEMGDIVHYFSKADINLDFNLDSNEFNNFIKFIDGRKLANTDLTQLYKLLGGSEYQGVPLANILHFFERRLKLTQGEIEFAFCTYEKDGDGYMERHEMEQALSYLGYPGMNHNKREVFKKYDTDGDNRITKEQFVQIVKRDVPLMFS